MHHMHLGLTYCIHLGLIPPNNCSNIKKTLSRKKPRVGKTSASDKEFKVQRCEGVISFLLSDTYSWYISNYFSCSVLWNEITPSHLWTLNSLSLADALLTIGFLLELFFDFYCSCFVVSDPYVCNMLNPDACDASMDWFYFFISEFKRLPMTTCVLDIIFT